MLAQNISSLILSKPCSHLSVFDIVALCAVHVDQTCGSLKMAEIYDQNM